MHEDYELWTKYSPMWIGGLPWNTQKRKIEYWPQDLWRRTHLLSGSRRIWHRRKYRPFLYAHVSRLESIAAKGERLHSSIIHRQTFKSKYITKPRGIQGHNKGRIDSSSCKSTYRRSSVKKRLRSEGGWFYHSIQQQEYQIILELSGEFPVKLLCELMNINRSSFYHWKKLLGNPSPKTKAFLENVQLFQAYHAQYPSMAIDGWMLKFVWIKASYCLIPMRIRPASRVRRSIINTKSLALPEKYFPIFFCQNYRLMGRCSVL